MDKKYKKFMKENIFKVSEGNLKVLETIPKMMMEKEWRDKLRKLILDYLFNQTFYVKNGR